MRPRARAYIAPDGDIRLVPPTGARYDELKEQLGATWDARANAWKVPALRTNALQIIEHVGRDDIDLDEAFLRIGDGWGFERQETFDLPETLFPYQRDAIAYLLSNPHGALLNMSPGLGKTAVAVIAGMVASRLLVVAPASLLYTWEREIKKWDNEATITIAHGRRPEPHQTYTITSYDTLATHTDWFAGVYDILILDETVLIKNRMTRRFKRVEAIRRRIPKVWMLSGNPATKHADDLWTMMNLAYPRAFRSYWRFADRFCTFEKNIWAKTGASIIGTNPARDLTWELGDVMFTVNQEDVLDLPDYLFEIVDIDLTKAQWKAYVSMRDDFIWELEGGQELDAKNKLSQLLRLQQITSSLANVPGGGHDSAKADALLELIEANAYPLPMIVWTHWRGGAQDLVTRLTRAHVNAVWVEGDMTTRARDTILEAFKAGKHDVLVLSLGVGKFGHTLTNARTIVYLDKTWNADDFMQSMRRVRRIGLTHQPVHVTLRARGTVDLLIEDNLAGKMPSIAKITNAQLVELLKGVGVR